MLEKLKQTAYQTIIYSIGNIGIKLIGFILLPLYTGHLTTSEYGIWAILELTSTFLVAVFGFKMSTAMMRWCSVLKSKEESKSIVFTTFISTLFFVFVLNALFQPFSDILSQLFFGNNKFEEYFFILFLSISFEIVGIFALDLIRLRQKPLLYICVTIIKVLTVLALNIYFIKYQHYGVKGIILSLLIGNIWIAVATLPFILKNIKPKIEKSELIPMFNYGFPLIFVTISTMILNLGDRYIIKYMLDYSSVGVYALGYKLASVLNVIIIQSFKTGFLPIAYKNFNTSDSNRFFSKTLTYYALVLVFCGLGLSLLSRELIEIFSKNNEYITAYTVVPPLTLAMIFRGIQYMFSLGLHFVKKTQYNAYIVVLAAILNIILNFLFIPVSGFYGAAISSVISSLAMMIAFYYYSQKHYYIDYEIKKICIILITGSCIYLLSTFMGDIPLLLRIFSKSLLLCIFPFILFLFNFYEPTEKKYLFNFFKELKWFNKNNADC